MNCLAIVDSANYALNLLRMLERKGYVFELVNVPCQLAKFGCGYCLKFPEEYKELVMNECAANNILIREMYRVIPMINKNKYEKIF